MNILAKLDYQELTIASIEACCNSIKANTVNQNKLIELDDMKELEKVYGKLAELQQRIVWGIK